DARRGHRRPGGRHRLRPEDDPERPLPAPQGRDPAPPGRPAAGRPRWARGPGRGDRLVTKYGAVRTAYNGQVYDSAGEAGYARRLDRRLAAGAIRAWTRGREWVLLDGPRRRDRITYRPDFEVTDAAGAFYVVRFKGY